MSRVLLAQLARFAVTGGVASGVYAIVAYVCVSHAELSGTIASVIAYAIAIPVSFLGQKFWTFRSRGAIRQELSKFLMLQIGNLVAAAMVMGVLTDALSLDPVIGIMVVVIVIPILTYVVLSTRIFTI
ncbi:MAG: GtrA family protein [Rhizobiaceae bacterium]